MAKPACAGSCGRAASAPAQAGGAPPGGWRLKPRLGVQARLRGLVAGGLCARAGGRPPPSRGFSRQATGTADDSAALTLRVVAQLQALYLPILRR